MEPITRDVRVACPHCSVVVRFTAPTSALPTGRVGWVIEAVTLSAASEIIDFQAGECPNCGRIVLSIRVQSRDYQETSPFIQVWPFLTTRVVPKEVPEHIARDYREATVTLKLSPKASAALSRRCLQAVLREAGKSNKKNLADQIDEVLPKLPTYVGDNVDAIRNIGNYAAHPQKSNATGEIVDVEPGEAEWNLDVLDQLFDFYYVQPAAAKAKRDALDAKLRDMGKPEMKKPTVA